MLTRELYQHELNFTQTMTNGRLLSRGPASVRCVDVNRSLDFSVEQSCMFCRSSKSKCTIHRGTFVPHSCPECLCARCAGHFTYTCVPNSTTRRIHTTWSLCLIQVCSPKLWFPTHLAAPGTEFPTLPRLQLETWSCIMSFQPFSCPIFLTPATGKILTCSSLWLLNVSFHGKKPPLISTVYK